MAVMKRYFYIGSRMAAIVIMLMMTAATALAQNVHVGQLFSRFGHARGCKMVEMHDTELKGYSLSVYKSLSLIHI